MVIIYGFLVNFFLLFFLVFISFDGNSETIKLRFNKIEIHNENLKTSRTYKYSKKINNFLYKDLFVKGLYEKKYLNIIIKKYQVYVEKNKKESLLGIFEDYSRDYIHKANLVFEIKDNENYLFTSFPIEIIESQNLLDTNYSIDRRNLNKKLSEKMILNLSETIRKKFLVSFGDFIVPN